MIEINDRSKRNLSQAFCHAVRQTLVRDPTDQCEIAPLEAGASNGKSSQTVLAITISSFTFRLMTVFEVPDAPANRDYYGAKAAGDSLAEVFAELANLCCGALNRELGASFAHLAMSIPYALSHRCLGFLGDPTPHFIARYSITINDSVRLLATLCMSCSASVEVAEAAAAVHDTGGALELF
jgi:hypothetical protein